MSYLRETWKQIPHEVDREITIPKSRTLLPPPLSVEKKKKKNKNLQTDIQQVNRKCKGLTNDKIIDIKNKQRSLKTVLCRDKGT